MLSRVTRATLISVAIGAITVTAAGCTAGGTTPAAAGKAAGSTTALSPQQAVDLAATKTTSVNSIAATVAIQGTTPSGGLSASGSIQEQLRPSLIVDADFSSFSGGGQALPGGIAEIITPQALYMRMAPMTQALHTTKPWVEVPLTGNSALGSALRSLLNDAQSSSPVTQTQMLSGARNVRKVGTGVIGGVPVTQYQGSMSVSQALAKLPASVRAMIAKSATAAGLKTIVFSIWLDAQQQPRQMVITETGTSISETITETITSFNQPVNVATPTAAETYTLPASVLGNLNG